MDIKERFFQKLHEDLLLYQRSVCRQSGSGNSNSNKNKIVEKLYNILLYAADELSEALLSSLIDESKNILESLYNNFVSKSNEDILYNELEDFVMKEIEEYEEDGCDWWNNPDYMEGV